MPVAFIVIGVGLGIVGLSKADGGLGWDELYGAFQLAALDDGAIVGTRGENDPPWTFNAGRFIAPFGVVLLVYRALVELVRSDLGYARAGRLRGHVVIAGLGHYGSHLAHSFRASGADVVCLDLDPHPSTAMSLRGEGVRVLTGDARDIRLTERIAVRRARYVIATCGDDGVNAEIAFAAGSLVEKDTKAPTVFVHLDDLRLWPELQAHAVSSNGRTRVRTEFFNVFETGARLLLEEHPAFRPPIGEGRAPHVLLCGLGDLGEQILVQLARRWEVERGDRSDPIAVTVLAPDAAKQVVAITAQFPRLADVASLSTEDVPVAQIGLKAAQALDDGVDIAYVCPARDSDGVATALQMQVAARRRGTELVLVLHDDARGVSVAVAGDGSSLRGISIFGLLGQALAPELVKRGTNETLAIAKHDHYRATERARGFDERSDPSLVSWEKLPDSLKESNRAFAERVGRKLDEAGCALVPNPFAPLGGGGFRFPPEEVEELARLEHRQWCEALMHDGWRRGPVKDPARKTHPMLISWGELSESERDKDRAPVRALSELVARVGFEIVRIDERRRLS